MLLQETYSVVVRHLGRCEYQPVMKAMQGWTRQRNSSTADEIWVLEHFPVYTRGVSCRDEPRCSTGEVPVVDSDRGGQITYHGPGQLVVYLLLDLRRLGLGIRDLVSSVERTVIGLLGEHAVEATIEPGAPGVYVSGSKVAAIGFRIHRGCCYHGLSLNVDMDLTPFQSIDPCGYAGLQVTQLRELGVTVEFARVRQRLVDRFTAELRYGQIVSGEAKLPVLAIHPSASQQVS